MIEAIIAAASKLMDPSVIMIIAVAIVIGWIVGVLPGIGAINALTIALPFTFGWEPLSAMYLLIAIYGACHFAGSITAILLNTPGEPVNAATVFDGFPMAKKGQAGKAIGIAAAGELLGALFGVAVLAALMPMMRTIVMSFGPPEVFWMVMLALAMVSWSSGKNMLKGLAAGGIGILLSLVGYSVVHSNVPRFMGNSLYLWEGLELVALVVGLLAVSAVIEYTLEGGAISKEKMSTKLSRVWEGVTEVFKHKMCLIRSSVVGIVVGIMPGIGPATSTFLGYSVAVQTSKHPETFGTGEPEGVLASEAAVGATTPGDLVPTLAFGIPGSAVMAVILGAFVLHGITPGPLLLRDNMDVAWALILGLTLSKVVASTAGVFAAPYLAQIATIKVTYLSPIIVVLCVVGAYVVNENLWDSALTLAVGIFGYAMSRFGFPIICLIMGYILGVLAEANFFTSLQMNWYNPAIFFRPIALVIFILFLLVLSIPFINLYRAHKKRKQIERIALPKASSKGSFWFTLVLIALVMVFVIDALNFPFKAAVVPWMVSIPTLTMLVLILISHKYPRLTAVFDISLISVREKKYAPSPTAMYTALSAETGAENATEPVAEPRPGSLGAVLRMVLWLAFLFIMILLVGFYITVPVFVFLFLKLHGHVGWLKTLLIAVIVGGLIYASFEIMMKVELFKGILFAENLPPL